MSEGIYVWLGILVPSTLIGSICGLLVKGRLAFILAGGIPWFGLLGALLYSEYILPYEVGGASMWPIAQLFGGTVAAVVGIIACSFWLKRRNEET